jgi:hypothetical protein
MSVQADEPVTGEADLWLLRHKAGLVVVADVAHCGGFFPLAMAAVLSDMHPL